MKTYWFTIADGEIYRVHAERLSLSLQAHGIPLTILRPGSSNSREAKHWKIAGILDAPVTYDRIVYLDADTLVLDPKGVDQVNGAWRIPWRIPVEGSLPKTLDPRDSAGRLRYFYQRHHLSVFMEGGNLEGVEWNSGVIAGNRGLLVELAQEWDLWWGRILELFDGHFRRDQLSFRIAYANVCLPRYPEGLPAEYNWIASYFGINPNAHILHRTMVRNVLWLEEGWESLAARTLAGTNVSRCNQVFDFSRIARDRPCLQRQAEVDRAVETDLLRQTLAFSQPKMILLCGIGESDERFLPWVRQRSDDYVCLDSLDHPPADLNLAAFDLILFCGVDYAIPESLASAFNHDAIFCFAGLHDMALYQHLYEFSYVRLLDFGFGLFSHSSEILSWVYEDLSRV